MSAHENVRPDEIKKFSEKAERWWDENGELKTLHQVNPLRIRFIARHLDNFPNCSVLDVGCGGGILSEGLARLGCQVTAIDMSPELIEIADLHSLEADVKIDYQQISVEQLAEQQAASFDVVTCMEMLEHVPRPASVVEACAKLVKPGGHVFFSTLNRNPKAYLLAIVAAEYLMKMIPKGTHEYDSFIKPSELCHWARQSDLQVLEEIGIAYNPVSQRFSLCDDIGVNYIIAFRQQD